MERCLHPYRKRKFFYGLAELFDEPPPPPVTLRELFPHADATLTDDDDELFVGETAASTNAPPRLHTHSPDGQPLAEPPGEKPLSPSPEEDSFEYVDFDKSRASLDSSASVRLGQPSQQSSLHDSMQDSMLFLPQDPNADASFSLSASQAAKNLTQEDPRTSHPTILSAGTAERPVELVDYFDLDRYCEAVPCWAYDNLSSCELHTEPMRRPMLLFCLQALDEFIAASSLLQKDGFLVESCHVARIVFAAMWEQDVRQIGQGSDVVIADYVAGKASLTGVSPYVWTLIDSCWAKHKHNFLHDPELYFEDSRVTPVPERVEQWRRVRQLLQVFSLKLRQAKRLEADILSDEPILSDRQLEILRRGSTSTQPIQFGLKYLQQLHGKSNTGWRRDVLSQSEWKIAFRAIEIHLKKWSTDVHIFPCGSFPRGAAFGSVVDVLVGLPEHDADDVESPVSLVLGALASSKIVARDKVHVVSPNRALAIIPYKSLSVVLDIKVYPRPQSWFALLYFTGPERFSIDYFSKLLKRSLDELSVVDFDHIYECVVDQLGLEVIASVDTEQHLFDLVGSEYIIPPQRI